MGRVCAECQYFCGRHEFSNNQWRKGEGLARCEDCVHDGGGGGGGGGGTYVYECTVYNCDRTFSSENSRDQHERDAHPYCRTCNRAFCDQNALDQHMRTHLPKVAQCPVCMGNKRYATAADVAAHLESGYCKCARGAEAGSRAVYELAKQSGYLLADRQGVMQLDEHGYEIIPDYVCSCGRQFKHASSMLQHKAAKGCR